MTKKFNILLSVFLLISILLPRLPLLNRNNCQPSPTTITILHHNDFHGQLEAAGSNPGISKAGIGWSMTSAPQ